MDRVEPPKAIWWVGDTDGHAELIDQTLLPAEYRTITCHDAETMWEAIKVLRIRGAPAIGVAAAMGVVLGVRSAQPATPAAGQDRLTEVCAYLRTSRPTAVNLFWALDRMASRGASLVDAAPRDLVAGLLDEAQRIAAEDDAMCRAIGQAGQALIADGNGVLTHCNAGALATAGSGTALSVMYAAQEKGRRFKVFADETRPLLQGARLTAWELSRAGIDVTVICDSMAAQVMKEKRVDLVITGADRIAGNGDTANKIGTYGVAMLARAHGIPFYVAAPASTFDLALADGSGIEIEHRTQAEISQGFGTTTVPADVACYNPAFDVTPADCIEAFITDRGLVRPVTREKIAEFFANRACNGGKSD